MVYEKKDILPKLHRMISFFSGGLSAGVYSGIYKDWQDSPWLLNSWVGGLVLVWTNVARFCMMMMSASVLGVGHRCFQRGDLAIGAFAFDHI